MPRRRPWWQRAPRALWWALALAILAMLAYTAWLMLRPAEEERAYFEGPDQVFIGDTAHFANLSRFADMAGTKFTWQLVDLATGRVERADSAGFNWELPIDSAGAGVDKEVVLIARGARQDTFRSALRIWCGSPPRALKIIGPLRGDTLAPLQFTVEPEEQQGFQLEWDMGDGATARGDTAVHQYQQAGVFTVRLRIYRPGAEGYCEALLEHRLAIGGDNAFLAPYALEEDKVLPQLNFSIGAWLLMGLLFLYLAYRWLRWLLVRPPLSEEEIERGLSRRFAHHKRAPYFIPFRNQDAAIRLAPSWFHLAERLRQRQQGERAELDVAASIGATVEQGGFPDIRLRRLTAPPDYLFLLDEQAAFSHQARLFQFLAGFLQQRDVALTLFYYNNEFHRFWNSRFPEGLNLAQLRNRYAGYRLVVLGDGQGLLHPFGRQGVALRQPYAHLFRQWPRRLLLSPRPTSSWAAQESILYQIFALFPGDTDGFRKAMAHLERPLDEDEGAARRPSFRQWAAGMQTGQGQPDVNFRNWRHLGTLKAYLEDYPDVYRWLCALAVYPRPCWELTLAIGRALGPLGVEVSFDKLLLLARIPWLQGEEWPMELRLALLEELDADAERLARRAVRQELEAAAPLVADSHAQMELQANLAIQNFALAPDEDSHQEALRFLAGRRLLSKKQAAELNLSLERSRRMAPPADIKAYLSEREASAIRPRGPRRPDSTFFRALGGSLLFLFLALAINWLDGTPRLYRWVMGEEPQPFLQGDTTRPLRNYFVLREQALVDSAVLYNNRGVAAWREDIAKGLPGEPAAIPFFQKALAYREGDYPLAAGNLGGAHFNRGAERYHYYLDNPRNAPAIALARKFFRDAAAYPSARLNAWHGIGLAHFVEARLDSAGYYYQLLDAQNFFDTLQLHPNLQTLLYPGMEQQPRCPGPVAAFEWVSATETYCSGAPVAITNTSIDTQSRVQQYVIDWGDGQRDTLPSFTGRSHTYQSQGCRQQRYTVRLWAYYACPDGGLTAHSSARNLAIVPPPPAPRIVPSISEACAPAEIRFALSPPCDGMAFRWQFGDGASSTEAAPAHTYSRPGTYTISLDMENFCGRSRSTATVRILRCAPNSITINGTVLDANTRRPVAGVLVSSVFGGPVTTDAQGRFRLQFENTAAYRGKALARFTKEGYEPLSRYITATSGTVNEQVFLSPEDPCARRGGDKDRDGLCADEDCNDDNRSAAASRDTDGDGLCDDADQCPSQAGPARSKGCPAADAEPEMILIPGGSFTMGCLSTERDGNCDQDEVPFHRVALETFYLSKHEITNGQFAAFLNSYGSDKVQQGAYAGQQIIYNHPWGIQGGNGRWAPAAGYEYRPVIYVTWFGAYEYCQWLARKTGRNYRLPTEAEWEYAARGGQQSQGYLYAGGDSLDDVGWHAGNSGRVTRPVGRKKANELGLYDMSGNVVEWVQDCWHDTYQNAPQDGSAWLARNGGDCTARVLRGGSWGNSKRDCRVAVRGKNEAGFWNNIVGFRVARD